MHSKHSTPRVCAAIASVTLGATLSLISSAALADRAPVARTAPAQPGQAGARLVAPVPPAPPVVQFAPLDPATIPGACKAQAERARSATAVAAVQARVSLASCMSEQAIKPLSLCDCGASIEDVNHATAPAFAVLDDVIAKTGPATQLVAEHAKGQLYSGFVVRLLTTVPKVGAGANADESALRNVRAQALDAQLVPWREAAQASYQHVVQLAQAHPELASNALVATSVRDSQQHLATDVAVTKPSPAALPEPAAPSAAATSSTSPAAASPAPTTAPADVTTPAMAPTTSPASPTPSAPTTSAPSTSAPSTSTAPPPAPPASSPADADATYEKR